MPTSNVSISGSTEDPLLSSLFMGDDDDREPVGSRQTGAGLAQDELMALSNDDERTGYAPETTPQYWAWQAGDYTAQTQAAAAASRSSVGHPSRPANNTGNSGSNLGRRHSQGHHAAAYHPYMDEAKPPATGSNALPLSPPSRSRALLPDPSPGSSSHCQACGASSNSSASSFTHAGPSHLSSYIRPCSFLRPGAIFKGFQSFTTYLSSPSSTSPNTSSSLTRYYDIHHRYRRQSPHPASAYPFSTYVRDLPSWNDIQDSAVDPRIQALLSAAPAYEFSGHGTAPKAARSGNKEEWEVHVSLQSVDYETGMVTGIMTALNVPNPSSEKRSQPVDQDIGAGGKKYANTVTTSFEGEIVDLHNHSLWTRAAPPEHWESYNDLNSGRRRRTASLFNEAPWLASRGTVDKATDLEYWSKVDAFAGFGAHAEKEICRIARDARWRSACTAAVKGTSDPQDYVLMRWKERDFIDCEASTSGLTISGFYYICLHRKSGSLTGYYYDPLSTPHQRLELSAARTTASAAGQADVDGGRWFGSYSLL